MKRRAKRLASSSKQVVPNTMSSISSFCHKSSGYFYWVYALLISLVIGVLALVKPDAVSINGGTFDTVMKMRWTSPVAAKDIVILDIDENSLAEMAEDYGRWPWDRKVFARALAELEYIEAKSILFTLLITDPDKDHPKSDATLSFVASESYVTVFPLVRLPKKNDQFSQLELCDLIPAGSVKCQPGIKLAAILPGVPGMRHDLGIINHKLDKDGTLRRANLFWNDGDWMMPTMVGGALSLAGITPKVDKSEPYLLNWRSKKNVYQKISFADYIATLNGDPRITANFFKDKHVIISASAPGLALQQVTSVGLRYDGDIIATSLDDAIHGTHLKPLPGWAVPLITVIFIWLLAVLFVFRRSQKNLDGIFAAIEGGVIGVMALAVNYTTYFIDLTPLVTFGLVYYGVGRVHHSMASKVTMGATHYMQRLMSKGAMELNCIGIIGFDDALKKKKDKKAKRWNFRRLSKELGQPYMFFCHDSFQKNQLLESANDVACIVVIAEAEIMRDILDDIKHYLLRHGVDKTTSEIVIIPENISHNKAFVPKFITSKALMVTSQVLNNALLNPGD